MNALIAVQDLIKTNEERIKVLKAQINDYDSGEVKVSAMAYASAENALEQTINALEKNKSIYNALKEKDLLELEKEERIKEAIRRKNYYKYQKLRIKRSEDMDNSQKLEAMRIIDELPSDINIEDKELFEIVNTSIKLDLRLHDELENELSEIKEEFNELIGNIDKEAINQIGMLQVYIPVLVLHLSVLVRDIQENIEEENSNTCFRGLPRFQDWWINELWLNHQAYFGLYRWKEIVSFLCVTDEQKDAWEVIFSNWIFIKKALNKKGDLAFEFNLAFDKMMEKFTGLEEELDLDNINSMDKIIQNITSKEDFHKFKHEHKVTTEFYEYKIVRM